MLNPHRPLIPLQFMDNAVFLVKVWEQEVFRNNPKFKI